jgi:hypothetical protein
MMQRAKTRSTDNLIGPSQVMRNARGEQGQGQRVSFAENHQGKDKNPVPWIQKYLELADLLIARVQHKREHDRHKRTKSQPPSDAVGPAQQRNRA